MVMPDIVPPEHNQNMADGVGNQQLPKFFPRTLTAVILFLIWRVIGSYHAVEICLHALSYSIIWYRMTLDRREAMSLLGSLLLATFTTFYSKSVPAAILVTTILSVQSGAVYQFHKEMRDKVLLDVVVSCFRLVLTGSLVVSGQVTDFIYLILYIFRFRERENSYTGEENPPIPVGIEDLFLPVIYMAQSGGFILKLFTVKYLSIVVSITALWINLKSLRL